MYVVNNNINLLTVCQITASVGDNKLILIFILSYLILIVVLQINLVWAKYYRSRLTFVETSKMTRVTFFYGPQC